MEDKYRMTREENIFTAKRNIVDYIYKSARLEGFNITFPNTDAIINGGVVSGLTADEIVTVHNLKHAWHFVLDNIDHETNFALVCEINRKVGANLIYNAGFVRNIPVRVGDFNPPLPVEADIKDELKAASGLETATERSITLMLTLMRRQVFMDGNKRTAMLAANHQMIKNGAGVISIPVERIEGFSERLMDYYMTNDMTEIKRFVYDECIDGLAFESGILT